MFGVFQGIFTLSAWHPKWKFLHFFWLLGRLSFSAWQLQERSVQEMCGLLLGSKGHVLFSIKNGQVVI